MSSIAIGVVKEIRPGEVILEFPFLQQSYRTDWVSMAMPMSGNGRGMFFMPEVDDEVVVGFDRGDFDHPFVIGCLWNGVDKPPESEILNRVIHTPGHHELRFEDKEGEKKVVVKSSSGHQVVLDDNANSITISDKDAKNKIVIDVVASQITVEATQKIVVEAPKIELVNGSTHPLVFGDELLTYLNTLVTTFNSHLHPGQLALGIFPVTPMTPVGPFDPAKPSLLSTKVTTG